MRSSAVRATLPIAPIAAVVLIAGCSAVVDTAPSAPWERGTSTYVTRPALPGFRKIHPIVYVPTDYGIFIFDQRTRKQIGSLTDDIVEAEGLFVDGNGTLYVADGEAARATSFLFGAQNASTLYQGAGDDALDVAKCKDGTLYVSAYVSASVAVYEDGDTTPSWYITNPDASAYSSVACDAASNVYVAYYSVSQRTGLVDEYPPLGRGTGKTLQMRGVDGLLALDSSGDIAFASGSPGQITFWAPGASSPYRTLSNLAQGVLGIRFAPGEQRLWVNLATNDPYFTVEEIDATSGRVIESLPPLQTNLGVAVYPADTF